MWGEDEPCKGRGGKIMADQRLTARYGKRGSVGTDFAAHV